MRERPGALNFGTTTVGSTNHLAANLLKSMTGLTFQIVPFRTPGELVSAVLRNDVDVIIQSYGALKSAVQGKQLRALAGTTPTRAAYAPDVPTVDEAGEREHLGDRRVPVRELQRHRHPGPHPGRGCRQRGRTGRRRHPYPQVVEVSSTTLGARC